MGINETITELSMRDERAPTYEYLYRTHLVTEDDATRAGLTLATGGDAKFSAWMKSKGWEPGREAAGNIRWTHATGGFVWLDDGVHYAAALMISALRGDIELEPQHGRVTIRDERPGLDILAEIAAIKVAPVDAIDATS